MKTYEKKYTFVMLVFHIPDTDELCSCSSCLIKMICETKCKKLEDFILHKIKLGIKSYESSVFSMP